MPADTPVVSIPTDGCPYSAVYDSGIGYVYVLDNCNGNVTVLNGTTIIQSLYVGDYPGSAVYDSGNGYVYVMEGSVSEKNGTVTAVSGNVTVIDRTSVVDVVNVGGDPIFGTYDDRNGYVYVAKWGSKNVTVINGTTVAGVVSDPTAEGFNGPVLNYATYDNANGYVYLVNGSGNDNAVSVIDGMNVIASVNAGVNQPQDPTYDPENGYVYVMSPDGNDIGIINGTTLLRTLPAGPCPAYAAYDPDNGYLYVSNSYSAHTFSGVTVINGTTVVGSIEVGSNPTSLVYDPENGYIYVADSGSTSVHVIDGMTAVENISIGLNPYWLVYDDGNGYVYAINQGSFATGIDYVSVLLVGYSVTASETGLPVGAVWWMNVTVGPSTFSNSSTISFSEPFGTYYYFVSAGDKRYSAPVGSFRVNSGQTFLEVQFSHVTYPVNFSETGLPPGTVWTVTLERTGAETAPAAVDFSEPNGTYSYKVGTLPGWTTSHFSGVIIVNGSAVSLRVSWTNVTYAATFTETGLPDGTNWAVNLSGILRASRSPTVVCTLWNGTYPYSVSTTNLNYSAFGGFLDVAGSAVSRAVVFSRVGFPVTFTESGLLGGTNWSVTFRNSTQLGAGNLVFLGVPNGTYAFTVGAVALYTATPASGTVRVEGLPMTEPVTFARSAYSSGNGSGTLMGLPAAEGYGVLEGVAIVILVAVVVIVASRPKRSPPNPAESDVVDPPSSP
jgi:YVTN family beta-propeller protein